MIHVVTAHGAEARPLVDRFRLDPLKGFHPYRIYEGRDLRLVVSGMGKSLSAAATAYLYALHPSGIDDVWVNVGIGGHGQATVGSSHLIEHVLDAGSGYGWPLDTTGAASVPRSRCITVDAPETEYPEDAVYDMEAAGFVASARRFTDLKRIRCVKVISDNDEAQARSLNKERVERLIRDEMESIGLLVSAHGE